jgi:hypothetical protein
MEGPAHLILGAASHPWCSSTVLRYLRTCSVSVKRIEFAVAVSLSPTNTHTCTSRLTHPAPLIPKMPCSGSETMSSTSTARDVDSLQVPIHAHSLGAHEEVSKLAGSQPHRSTCACTPSAPSQHSRRDWAMRAEYRQRSGAVADLEPDQHSTANGQKVTA